MGGSGPAGRPPAHLPQPAGAPSYPGRPREPERGGEPSETVGIGALTIGNAIVELLRLHAGRGPGNAKATILSDLVVVHLRDCLTTAERTLDEIGLAGFVAKSREGLHEVIRLEATAVVEEVTGRRVVSYLSAQQSEPDHALIGFVLGEPATRSDG